MQNDPLDSTEPLARALASTRTGLGRVTAGQFPAGQTTIELGHRSPDAVGLLGPESPAPVGVPPVGRLAVFSGRAV